MTSDGLVLSGGGPVGIAWEAGILAGLTEAGADVTGMDRVVGTSAGSVVGALLAIGVPPSDIIQRERDRASARDGDAEASEPPEIPTELLAAFLGDAEDAQQTRAQVGAFALGADTESEQAFLDRFGERLVGADWPHGFVCTAVDTADGAFVVLDADAGVPLVRAVAASCAVPGIFPPVTVGDRRYMDGGIRSVTNADLAEGCDRVTVLSLFGLEATDPRAEPLAQRLRAEVERLEASGATVRICTPDEASQAAIGPNPMDERRAAAAAEAGLVQGRAEASRLT